MEKEQSVHFVAPKAIKGREEDYELVEVECAAILKSWGSSLYAFEWLHPDGTLRQMNELAGPQQEKRQEVEKALAQGAVLEHPVLGIGVLECVEIGSGLATFLTLSAAGRRTLPVYIAKTAMQDFTPFLVPEIHVG